MNSSNINQPAIDHFVSCDEIQQEAAVTAFLLNTKGVTANMAYQLLKDMLNFIKEKESFEFFKWYKENYLNTVKG